jgi:hypothetical protein
VSEIADLITIQQRVCCSGCCEVKDEDFCTCKTSAGFLRGALSRAIDLEADNVRLRELLALCDKALAWAGSPSPEWGGATVEETDRAIRDWSTPMRRLAKLLRGDPHV